MEENNDESFTRKIDYSDFLEEKIDNKVTISSMKKYTFKEGEEEKNQDEENKELDLENYRGEGEEEKPKQGAFSTFMNDTTEWARGLSYKYLFNNEKYSFPKEENFEEFVVIRRGYIFDQKRNLRLTNSHLYRVVQENQLVRNKKDLKDILKVVKTPPFKIEIYWKNENYIDIYEIENATKFINSLKKREKENNLEIIFECN